jgi:hypothetical protein
VVSCLSDRSPQRAGLGTGAPGDPVLALGGEHNYGQTIVAMLTEFAMNVSGRSIAGCVHWLAEERPTEPADRLIEFLN